MAGIDGLYQVIVTAQIECQQLLGDVILGGQEQDRQLPVFLLLAQDGRQLQAAATGHVQVQQQHVGPKRPQRLLHLQGFGLAAHLHAGATQMQGMGLQQQGIVIHHQHPVGFLRHLPDQSLQQAQQVRPIQGAGQVAAGTGAVGGQANLKIVPLGSEDHRGAVQAAGLQVGQQLDDGRVALGNEHGHDHRGGSLAATTDIPKSRQACEPLHPVALALEQLPHLPRQHGIGLQQVDYRAPARLWMQGGRPLYDFMVFARHRPPPHSAVQA